MSKVEVHGFQQEDGTWHFQRAPYIDGGWYIEEFGKGEYNLYEIPLCGENAFFISRHDTFGEAYKKAMTMT